jgi:hypothetical protein
VRERKSGDVIWHNKRDNAPHLIRLGSQLRRMLVIELKGYRIGPGVQDYRVQRKLEPGTI